MRKLLAILSLVAVTFSPTPAWAGKWNTEGVKVNPIVGVVLADMGPVVGATGQYGLSVVCTANAGSVVALESRNPTNTVTIKSQLFAVQAFSTIVFTPLVNFELLAQERLRLVMFAPVTGSVQCSLFNSDPD